MNVKNRDSLFLLVLFVLVHIVMYRLWGIVTDLEAVKYIQEADLLLKGGFPSAPKYYCYLPIILLIAVAQKFSLGYTFVVLVQSGISAFALLLFYQGTRHLISRPVGLVSSILLCAFLPFFSWNLTLYSESIFISLSLILYYLICRFESREPIFAWLIFAILTLLLFTRPTGVLFVPPVAAYFLLMRHKNQKVRWVYFTCIVLYTTLMINLSSKILHGGGDMDLMKPNVEEHIICFVPQKPAGAQLELKHYDNSLANFAYYITHNPKHFFTLLINRLGSFFSMTRPWYSHKHNIAILSSIIPVYLFFFLGLLRSFSAWRNSFFYLIALLVLYPIGISLQCDDWHSRFTMLVLPGVFVFAGLGVSSTYQLFKSYEKI